MPFLCPMGATFLGFAFFMNGTHGEMTRFSGNAIPMRGGNAPAKWKGPGRLLRFFFSALISFLKKNTVAEPMLVIKNVNPVPAIAHKIACVISYSLLLKVSLS